MHPGYLYRLVGFINGSKVELTEWRRNRDSVVSELNRLLAEDRADGLGDTRADYKIECLSADWFA